MLAHNWKEAKKGVPSIFKIATSISTTSAKFSFYNNEDCFYFANFNCNKLNPAYTII